jgi:hypothetical protein
MPDDTPPPASDPDDGGISLEEWIAAGQSCCEAEPEPEPEPPASEPGTPPGDGVQSGDAPK